jgi:hypothetical protein
MRRRAAGRHGRTSPPTAQFRLQRGDYGDHRHPHRLRVPGFKGTVLFEQIDGRADAAQCDHAVELCHFVTLSATPTSPNLRWPRQPSPRRANNPMCQADAHGVMKFFHLPNSRPQSVPAMTFSRPTGLQNLSADCHPEPAQDPAYGCVGYGTSLRSASAMMRWRCQRAKSGLHEYKPQGATAVTRTSSWTAAGIRVNRRGALGERLSSVQGGGAVVLGAVAGPQL